MAYNLNLLCIQWINEITKKVLQKVLCSRWSAAYRSDDNWLWNEFLIKDMFISKVKQFIGSEQQKKPNN